MTVDTAALNWIDEGVLEVNGARFAVSSAASDYLNRESSETSIVLAKRRDMVEHIADLVRTLQPKRVVDLGIYKGGSTAFLASFADLSRLSAIDFNPEPVAVLDAFVASRGLSDVVALHYGVNQGDKDELLKVIEKDHGDEPLDLVVDDASHLYPESRASFEVLFPRLRPGGVFVLEDWAWAHFPEELWQDRGGWFHDRPALTNLVVEFLLIAGTDSELISEIRVSQSFVEVVRGPLQLSSPMRIEDHHLNRGLPFRPLL